MESKTYQVISEFDEQKDYGFSIRPRHKKCLTLLQNNQTLTPKDFLSKHLDDIGKKEIPLKQKKDIFYQAMSIGKKIDVISDYSQYPTNSEILLALKQFIISQNSYGKIREKIQNGMLTISVLHRNPISMPCGILATGYMEKSLNLML